MLTAVLLTMHASTHPQLYRDGGALNDFPCGAETVMGTYLAIPSVMEAIHVKPNNQQMTYRRTAGNLLPLYAELIAKYRMLIYSGDVDGCVPCWGSEEVRVSGDSCSIHM